MKQLGGRFDKEEIWWLDRQGTYLTDLTCCLEGKTLHVFFNFYHFSGELLHSSPLSKQKEYLKLCHSKPILVQSIKNNNRNLCK